MMARTNRRKTSTTIASLSGYSNIDRQRLPNKNQPNSGRSTWKSWAAKTFLFLLLVGSVVFYVRLVRHSLQNANANVPTSALEIPDRPLPYPNSGLPLWIQDYILWHGQQRAALNATNWQDRYSPDNDNNEHNEHSNNSPDRPRFQFLVVRCLANDQKCGGTADRLRPLPLYVWIAAHLKRILLIQWERPCALQEFLVPPADIDATIGSVSVDWTWPDFFPTDTTRMFSEHAELEGMVDLLPYVDTDWTTKQGKKERRTDLQERSMDAQEEYGPAPRRKRAPEDLPQFISMLYQSAGHGANFYNEHRYHQYKNNDRNDGSPPSDEPDHDHVLKPLWRAFFAPSPAVQSLLDRERQALHLTTDHYVAVHIRSQYQNYNSDLQIRTLVRHAMNCGSQLQQKLPLVGAGADTAEPIFVATDSSRAATAVATYGKRRNANYFRQRESTLAESDASSASEPLHLDRGSAHLNRNASGWTTAQDPANYYDTFVDLYLLAGSRCITYHVGGYGRWANLLSSNLTCEMNHLKNKCSWTEPTMDAVTGGIQI
jgi:hypothetical protein